MWLFKRKKADQPTHGPQCTYCRSTNTVVMSSHGADHFDYIRTWRGQRYVTSRCLDCGRAFYAEESQQEIEGLVLSDDRLIDDEEELRKAEEEVKKQADDEGDHRYKII